MKLTKRLLLTIGAALVLSTAADAQCRSYTKRKCMPDLGEYVHDGKMNFVQLYAGDKAELMLTFYPGQDYRLLVCNSPEFDSIRVKVKDVDNNVVFEEQVMGSKTFDFRVASAQQLLVTIKVPQQDRTTHELDFTGCVSILTGMKKEE